MALTVESLSKSLRKTTDEVIAILTNVGIENKDSSSEISAVEKKILMNSLQKRSSSNSVISISHKLVNKGSSVSTGGIKIQVKKTFKVTKDSAVDVINADIIKVHKALKINRLANEKTQVQEQRQKEITPYKKKQDAEYKAQQNISDNENKQVTTYKKEQKLTPIGTQQETQVNTEVKTKVDTAPSADKRKQLHFTGKVAKRKLKKKDRTAFLQKIQEEKTQHAFQKPSNPVIHEVQIPENIKIYDLAQKMTIKAGEILKILMDMGVVATLNDVIDQDTAMLVVEEMGHKGVASKEMTVEDDLLLLAKNISGKAETRPPVVTIMGHVDHGKTSLLDYIRNTKVVDSEVGSITQHIGAYQITNSGNTVTFIDTPGHAAFVKMRSRGANATDIVVLVVAADDGVMPQTIESIKHAKEANVPIIVAINKIDKKGIIALDKIKQMLSNYEVVFEEWGGDVVMVPVSAHTGEGIDKLLEAISLTAEISEFSAVFDCYASGVVLEACLDKGRGKITTVLVRSGTLKKGDILIAGLEYGKVKQIIDYTGKPIDKATPSMPVKVIGLSGVPDSGSDFLVVDSEQKAREVSNFRKIKDREAKLQKQRSVSMEDLLLKMKDIAVVTLNILVKADVKGSAQALVESLEKLSTDKVKLKIILHGVGAINNTDIVLASTSGAIVLGFNVRADSVARKTAENEGVKIKYYNIIYDLIDDVKAIMDSMLEPEFSKNIIGTALVKDVFKSIKFGDIAGCVVIDGVVRQNSLARVLRENIVTYEGELQSLRRFKDNVEEVKSGTECGIGILNYTDIKINDQIEVFELVESIRPT